MARHRSLGLVAGALALVGLSLLLGLFTQLGCTGALLLLGSFYLAAIPTLGVPQAGAEGTYLLVNKTLIELGAVLVLLAFRTGRIAGLDVLRLRRATAG
jgi:thiosulfate dehydrogenase [quinone] large subunit